RDLATAVDALNAGGDPRGGRHPAVLGHVQRTVGARRRPVGPAAGHRHLLDLALGRPTGDAAGRDLGEDHLAVAPHGPLRKAEAGGDDLSGGALLAVWHARLPVCPARVVCASSSSWRRDYPGSFEAMMSSSTIRGGSASSSPALAISASATRPARC